MSTPDPFLFKDPHGDPELLAAYYSAHPQEMPAGGQIMPAQQSGVEEMKMAYVEDVAAIGSGGLIPGSDMTVAGIPMNVGQDRSLWERVLSPTGGENLAYGTLPIGGLSTLLSGLGITIPAGVATALGVGGAIYGGLQALGLGEGGGLFGNNLLGGDGYALGSTGLTVGGPGVAEVTKGGTVLKEWSAKYNWGKLTYWLVQKTNSKVRYIIMHDSRTGKLKWWRWRTPHLAVIGKNMPSHKQITRLRRNLSRHKADINTMRKLVDPAGYMKSAGYYKPRRRR